MLVYLLVEVHVICCGHLMLSSFLKSDLWNASIFSEVYFFIVHSLLLYRKTMLTREFMIQIFRFTFTQVSVIEDRAEIVEGYRGKSPPPLDVM